MANYKLLRSNKELGPYSLEGIISLGLKPYDLIWVEGRSAAWRYPSEIPELKPYAPIVEEQPYDRFYKKKSEPTPHTPKEINTPVIIKPKEKVELPTVTVSRTAPVVVIPQRKSQPVTVIGKAAVQMSEEPKSSEMEATQPASVKEEVVLETKYERSLDDITDQFIENLVARKQKYGRRFRMNRLAQIAAIVLFVGGLGTLVVLTLTSKASKSDMTYSGPVETETDPIQNAGAVGLLPATKTESGDSFTGDIQTLDEGYSESEKRPVSAKTGKTRKPEEKTDDPVVVEEPKPVIVEEGVREKRTRTEGREANSPEALQKMVKVTANNYKRAAFGGIKDLELTVNNSSSYLLDVVQVELSYLKPSEQPLKTETIYFRSVAPGGTMTIKIPDSNRGIKVSYKIRDVSSGAAMDEWAQNEK